MNVVTKPKLPNKFRRSASWKERCKLCRMKKTSEINISTQPSAGLRDTTVSFGAESTASRTKSPQPCCWSIYIYMTKEDGNSRVEDGCGRRRVSVSICVVSVMCVVHMTEAMEVVCRWLLIEKYFAICRWTLFVSRSVNKYICQCQSWVGCGMSL